MIDFTDAYRSTSATATTTAIVEMRWSWTADDTAADLAGHRCLTFTAPHSILNNIHYYEPCSEWSRSEPFT